MTSCYEIHLKKSWNAVCFWTTPVSSNVMLTTKPNTLDVLYCFPFIAGGLEIFPELLKFTKAIFAKSQIAKNPFCI